MRSIEHARRVTVAGLLAVMAVHTVRAQSVRGVVRGAESGAPFSGLVVVLRDTSANDLAQAVTTSSGAFVLRAPAAGPYTVRVRRIGFRPSDVRVRLRHADTTLVITMSEVPARLTAVVTHSSGQCRAHPDSASATWALWDAAEIAMLNASITMREERYHFDAEYARRWYDMNPDALRDIAIRDSTIRDSKPWTTVRPEVVERSGFAVETPGVMTVIAPDLPVLLSRNFLDEHCFAIHAASAAKPDLVGLDFAPISRGRFVDIRGTFWLDRQSGEIRYLDYHYDGFPFSMRDTLAGGRVGFVHLSTGAWVLSNWWIRAPVPPQTYLTQAAVINRTHSRPVEAGDPHFRAVEFTVTGGGVRTVRGDDSADSLPIWSAPVSTVRAILSTQSGHELAPVGGATIRLVGTRRQGVTDSSGVARVEGLLEGEYIAEVTSPLQAALLLPPTRLTFTAVPPAEAEVRALVLSPQQAVQAACGAMNATRGILVGTVTRSGTPEPQAKVFVQSDVDPSYSPPEAKLSADGTFRVCDVPRGEALTVVAVMDGRVKAKVHITIPTDQIHETVDLVLP